MLAGLLHTEAEEMAVSDGNLGGRQSFGENLGNWGVPALQGHLDALSREQGDVDNLGFLFFWSLWGQRRSCLAVVRLFWLRFVVLEAWELQQAEDIIVVDKVTNIFNRFCVRIVLNVFINVFPESKPKTKFRLFLIFIRWGGGWH